MSAQSGTVVKAQSAIVGEYVSIEATVSTGDTVKVTYLSQISNAVALRMRDWSLVNFTWAGNILTVITPGVSTDRIIILAGGIV